MDDAAAPALPDDLAGLSATVLSEHAADLLELVLSGLLRGRLGDGPGYLSAAQRRAVQATGRLPDGTPWELPLALRAADPAPGRRLLRDREHVPLAVLDVTEAEPDGDAVLLAGPLTPLRGRSHRPFDRLRATPGPPRAPEVLAVPADRPLLQSDLDTVAGQAERHGAAVTLLALVGDGRPTPRAALARALLAGAEALRDAAPGLDVAVRLAALPSLPGLPAAAASAVTVRVAAATGATRVLLPHGTAAPGAVSLPVPADVAAPSALDADVVRRLLESGDPLPERTAPAGVERELRRLHPAPASRGLVLLFTGLSGSGKSTVAAGVVDALAELGEREVTVLDGDVVRTMLSAGLGFSRADRELNVRRIGFVAAEVARHGGTAVCAPIAPYAATRAEVRAMVEAAGGALVLVHVATPLAVCEARDRKGLYARARKGVIPEFTGVSDPYEEPEDADLRLDTSVRSTGACVEDVIGLLADRGLVRGRLPRSAGRDGGG